MCIVLHKLNKMSFELRPGELKSNMYVCQFGLVFHFQTLVDFLSNLIKNTGIRFIYKTIIDYISYNHQLFALLVLHIIRN